MTKPVYFNICGCGVALRRKVGTRLVTTGVQSCVVLLVCSRHYFFAIHLDKKLTRDINHFRLFCMEVKEAFERKQSDINECFLCYTNNPDSLPHANCIYNTISEVLVAPTLFRLQGAQDANVEFYANYDWIINILPYNDQGSKIYLVAGERYIDEIRTVRETHVREGLKENGLDGFAVGIDEVEEQYSDFENEYDEEEEYATDYGGYDSVG